MPDLDSRASLVAAVVVGEQIDDGRLQLEMPLLDGQTDERRQQALLRRLHVVQTVGCSAAEVAL